MTRLLGVIPAADRGGHIGGAPPALLQTGEGTFLERAIALLRAAGVERIIVGVRNGRDPVAVQALRGGAEVAEVEPEGRDPSASLRAAQGKLAGDRELTSVEASSGVGIGAEASSGVGAEASSGDGASAAAGPENVSFLLLPPTYPEVRESTVLALVQGWRAAGEIPNVAAPLLPEGTSMAQLPWHELAPLILRGPGAADRLHAPEAVGGPDLLRIPVTDPGVGQRIDTLPLYRRHFPQAFRRRFQKW